MTLTFTGGIVPTGGIQVLTNQAPTWVSSSNLGSNHESETITESAYSVVATDPDDGPQALTYKFLSGTLPTGATLNSNGTITGPAIAVSSDTQFDFIAEVFDGISKVTRDFSITINENEDPTWTGGTAADLGDLDEETAANIQLTAVDADGLPMTLTYSVVSGSLPSGLTLNSSGLITGTAPEESSDTAYMFTVRADDGDEVADRQFTLTILNIILPGFVSWDNSLGAFTTWSSGHQDSKVKTIDSTRVLLMKAKHPANSLGLPRIMEIDSGTNLTLGNDSINSGASNNSRHHNIVVLSTTKGIIAWNDLNDSNKTKCSILSFSGITISRGNVSTLGDAQYAPFEMAPIDSTRALLFDTDSGYNPRIHILTVSGDNVSRASITFPESGFSRIASLEKIDSTRFLGVYWLGNERKAIIITVTGATTATFGSIVTVADGTGLSAKGYDGTILDSSSGVVCYKEVATGDNVVTELSFSGDTITVGTTVIINDVVDGVGQVTAINSTEFFLTSGRLPSGGQGHVGQYGKLDSGVFTLGTAISTGSFSLETDFNLCPLSTVLFDAFRIVSIYRHGGNSTNQIKVMRAPE